MSSAVLTRQWKCERCGKAWINTITLKAMDTPNPQRVDALIVCPSCGNNYAIMGKPGHEIEKVETNPAAG